MNRDDLRNFVATLHEPSVVSAADGRFRVANDAFRSLLREYGRSNAERLHDIVADDPADVDTFLRSAVRTRPSIQGSLTFADGTRDDRMACYGGVLRPPTKDRALLLLRFYRGQETVRRFRLLGRKIEELNAEIRRRRAAEEALHEIRRTLEKRVEKRTADLERANDELVRSNQSLEEFAYVASHDLREPLRKISMFGELLEAEAGRDLSEEHRSMLSRITNAADRMNRLIDGLLTYSRVSSASAAFEQVDLNRVVREVLADLEVLVARSDAVVDVDELPVLEADATQMRQLFQNLISNSIKFRRPDEPPRIRIRAFRNPDGTPQHVIELSDNGIGFEPEFAKTIFDPFRRLNTRGEFEGAGIGLAVCRRIVERHDGEISATGRPGEGAVFHVVLPADVRAD